MGPVNCSNYYHKTPAKDNPRNPYHTLTSTKPTKQPGVVASNEEHSRDRTGNRCYHCHGTGHFQKSCPLRDRAALEESRGQNSGAAQKDSQQRVAALVADPDRDHQQKQKRVVELQCTLQEAEVDESLSERVVELQSTLQEAEVDESLSEEVATMRVLKLANGEDAPVLGKAVSRSGVRRKPSQGLA